MEEKKKAYLKPPYISKLKERAEGRTKEKVKSLMTCHKEYLWYNLCPDGTRVLLQAHLHFIKVKARLVPLKEGNVFYRI